MKPLTKIKIVIAILLSMILAVFVALNMQPTEVNLIVDTVYIRCSILILACVLVGLFLGWVVRIVYEHKVGR